MYHGTFAFDVQSRFVPLGKILIFKSDKQQVPLCVCKGRHVHRVSENVCVCVDRWSLNESTSNRTIRLLFVSITIQELFTTIYTNLDFVSLQGSIE